MASLWRDFRYAGRALAKRPGFTAVVVVTLALGIGANSAIFSVVDALLLRPLPYPQPDRLAVVWLHSPAIGIARDWPSPGEYIDVQNENHSFQQMALAKPRPLILSGREQAEQVNSVQTQQVNSVQTQSNLFNMLGAKPQLGRLLSPDEDKPGAPPVAVLSDSFWKRSFGSDSGIVGKSATMNGTVYTIVGVLTPDFMLDSEVMTPEVHMDTFDVFLPLPLAADAASKRDDENYNIIAKLKPGVSVREAQADIDRVATHIRQKDKRGSSFGMDVVSLRDQVVGDVRRALLLLFLSVGLVLFIACANITGLLLTRAAGREKEMAIRTALGADWQRLARQLLAESILLAAVGGAAGLLVAELGIALLRAMNPGNVPRLHDIAINGSVLAFTATFIPAWRATKVDPSLVLREE